MLYYNHSCLDNNTYIQYANVKPLALVCILELWHMSELCF